MEMLNRIAVVLTPRRRFFEWANALPDSDPPTPYEERKNLRAAFLIVGPDEATVDDIIADNWEDLFQAGLSQWSRDPSFWPVNRTAHIFRDWYEVDVIDWLTDLDPSQPFTVAEQMRSHCAACDGELDDTQVGLALQRDGGFQRWTADQMDEWQDRDDDGGADADADADEQDADEDDTGDPGAIVLAVRCCGPECAERLEANFVAARREADQEEEG